AARGKIDEAETEFSMALQLKPDNRAAREALALILIQRNEMDRALACLEEGLRIQPTPKAHFLAASILVTRGQFQPAIQHYLEALRAEPNAPAVLNDFAWLLATCADPDIRDGVRAVQYAEQACQLTEYKQTILVGTLAA